MLSFFCRYLSFASFLLAAAMAQAQPGLVVYSGNGQAVLEQFRTNIPLTVQARSANGSPLPGVSVTFAITQGSATLSAPTTVTDANGLASTYFVATTLQPGTSWQTATVTASAASGSASFFVTTIGKSAGTQIGALPVVQLLQPPAESRSITGAAGSTLAGAIQLRVVSQSGPLSGQGIANIGIRLGSALEGEPLGAQCRGGTVLTDATGLAVCDVVLGASAGTFAIVANAGEFQNTPAISLQISPGAACTYTVGASTLAIPATGGSASINVTAPANCTWTAASNAAFLTVTSSASTTGNGTVTLSAAANPGGARSGTLTVAGQTVTINQPAATPSGPALLAISSGATLPSATVNTSYAATLTATGGSGSYTWSTTGILPPGLAFSPQGSLSGTPTQVGTFSWTVTVRDALNATASQAVSLTVGSAPAAGSPVITNTTFPAGVVNSSYSQGIAVTGGCVNPFSPVAAVTVTAGALPVGLTLRAGASAYTIEGIPAAAGSYSFSLTASDGCGRSSNRAFTIVIQAAGGAASNLTAAPAVLVFEQTGNTRPPEQTIALQSAVQGTPFTVAAATSSGGNWLQLSGGTSGVTPAQITVGITPGIVLAAGSYTGSITFTTSNSALEVPVTLNVASAVSIELSTATLTFAGSGSQSIAITAPGQTTVGFAAAASTNGGGNWLSVTPVNGSAPGNLTVTVNAAGLAVGSYTGLISLTPLSPGAAPKTVLVSLTIAPPGTTSFTIDPDRLTFRFDPGVQPPASQSFLIGSTGSPLFFSATSVTAESGGWLFLSPASGTTPQTVNVSVNPVGLLPGVYSGSIRIAYADINRAPLNVPVTLAIGQQTPVLTSVTNAASFQPGPVAPGEILVLFGNNLGPSSLLQSTVNAEGLLATSAGGTRVLFDGVPAPMLYASSSQAAAIVPYDVDGRRTVRMEVEVNGVRSAARTLDVTAAAPGIFTLNASGQGAILNQNSSVNSPDNPARLGSVISIYATGEGATDPAGVNGKLAGAPLPKPRLPVRVTIDGIEAEVLYQGAAPGLTAGVMQVNARVPDWISTGSRVRVLVFAGDARSQANVTLAVGP